MIAINKLALTVSIVCLLSAAVAHAQDQCAVNAQVWSGQVTPNGSCPGDNPSYGVQCKKTFSMSAQTSCRDDLRL
jgi:hypothetical protein